MKEKNKKQVIRDILGIGVNLNISPEDKLKLDSDENEIHTMDILHIALENNVKQQDIIEFLNLLRNDVKAKIVPDS